MFIFFKYSTVCSYEDESELIVKDWVHHAAAADAPCTVFNLLNVAAQAAGCPPVRRQPLWQDNLIKKTNTATKRGASEMLLFETHFQITLDPKRLKRFEPIPKKLEASLKEKTSFFYPPPLTTVLLPHGLSQIYQSYSLS